MKCCIFGFFIKGYLEDYFQKDIRRILTKIGAEDGEFDAQQASCHIRCKA